MVDIAIAWLKGVFGENVVFGIIIVGFLIYIAVKLTRWITLSKQKLDTVPCDKHEESITKLTETSNRIDVTLARIEERVGGMDRRIDLLQGSVAKILEGGNKKVGYTESHSPLNLTTKGKAKADELGYEGILDKNWNVISAIIEGDKNPYDIQSAFIINLISKPENYIDQESLDRIKNDAYINGNALIDYMRMMAVMARDRYFKEHNIQVEEVDKHDPSKK